MHMYLDAWNYATFAALAIIVLGFVLLVFSFWAFREHIAVARKHPEGGCGEPDGRGRLPGDCPLDPDPDLGLQTHRRGRHPALPPAGADRHRQGDPAHHPVDPAAARADPRDSSAGGAERPVKKGQPLFQFDRRPYEDKVRQLEAQLAAARQNVFVLKVERDAAAANVAKAKADLWYSETEYLRQQKLVPQRASSVEDLQKAEACKKASQAAVAAAQAEYKRARLKYGSEIEGVNTTVAQVQAELEQARYYLDNTTMAAPEDGHIINLQVRPGMVAGEVRFGAIASFIVDADRYLLGTF